MDGTMDDPLRGASASVEEDCFDSALQLRLAASLVSRLVERNGGSAAADLFWNEDTFDNDHDQDEYLDAELWDPDSETVPEMAAIMENISGGL